uniref:N-acetyltransferase domain-containing protein n=1 Tax=Fibrocapsa japonica TaxID=94617 RepID=A0A7S2UWU8_9STRA|mmetsp:Transcript_17811/g.25982  ORF Transcript_17811/g.25982 Transcript_17811/m.25982 type:complete len:281 (+) Transcript_17811:81-923(+)
MGCGVSSCCIPRAEVVEYTDSALPEGFVGVNESSDKKLIAEFVEVLALSFCGSTTSSPEASISWAIDAGPEGSNPVLPLSSEPSKERKDFYNYLMKFIFLTAARHGMCFALQDDQGKIVAAAVAFPPNNRRLHETRNSEWIHIIRCLGGFSNLPKYFTSGRSAKVLGLLDKMLHKAHRQKAPLRHLYVHCFATHPSEQGKGYGRKLAEFLNSCADYMRVPTYLETNGVSNERFYGKNGFVLVGERMAVEVDGQSFKPDGLEGISCMLREPAVMANVTVPK